MRYLSICCYFLWQAVVPLRAQDTIGGQVNFYAAVWAIDYCTGRIELADTAGFKPGMSALLIQMQGAAIEQGNDASFGLVTAWGSAGLCERIRIDSVGAQAVWASHELVHTYQPGEGSVQLVSLPEFEGQVVVSDTLSCRPWDGHTGGVLALEVRGLLELWAPIDVSARGFRGGPKVAEPSQCLWFLQQDDWFYPLGSWRGAPKGEGVARWIAGKEAGRGPQANGGGGGNDHNAGGGGGAHLAAGGQGGEEVPPSIFGCYGPYPGKGGRPLADAPGLRLFMGGGGGAGHTEYLAASNAGGRGGGILLLWADSLQTHGFGLSANGMSLPLATGESGGGGGAGGTIWLEVDVVLDALHLSARGGDGGSVANQVGRCAGPGGGGAGGRVLASLPVQADLAGGQPGINLNPGPCGDPTSGAMPGQAGLLEALPLFPEGTQPLSEAPSWLVLPAPATACLGDTASFSAVAAGSALSYQWQMMVDGVWIDLSEGAPFWGVHTPTLVLAPLADSLDGRLWRCVSSSPCFDTLASPSAALQLWPAPAASFTYEVLADQLVAFSAQAPYADSVRWHFGDGTTSTQLMPVHAFPSADSFWVTLTSWHPCGPRDTGAWVLALAPPQPAFSLQPSQGCAPLEVQFFDMSQGSVQSWSWSFPGGVPAQSSEPDPVVSYADAGAYDVKLEVANAAGVRVLSETAAVQVWAPPLASFDWQLEGLTLSVVAADSSASLSWDFGDGSPLAFGYSQTHTYDAPGLYYVTLVASHSGCAAIQTVPVWVSLTRTYAPVAGGCRLTPNPARTNVRLSCVGAGHTAELTVFDVVGRRWGRWRLSANETLDVSAWPAGVYFVYWYSGTRAGIEKLVVP